MTRSAFEAPKGTASDADSDAEGQHQKVDFGQQEHIIGKLGATLRSKECPIRGHAASPYRRLLTPPPRINAAGEDFSELDQRRVHHEQGRVRSKERTLIVPVKSTVRRDSNSSNQSHHSLSSFAFRAGQTCGFSDAENDSQNSKYSKRKRRKATHFPAEHNPNVDDELVNGTGIVTKKEQPKKVFVDAEQMKEKIRNAAFKKAYNVCDFYYDHGLFQRIARHPKFEALTLAIIAFNALWITVDTDANTAEVLLHALPVFQVVEQFFCLYFSFEWFVRFKSFAKKRNALRDAWFVFDSCLVLTMVLETWLMATVMAFASTAGGGGLGNASMLRLARLLRLSRMARMARLFRAMPELLILIKAMAASLRSCFFVFILLTIILYIFGIAFRQLTDASDVGEKYFFTVFASMHTLWKFGTLLDGLGDIVTDLSEDGYGLVALFYLFLLLSALTVMNMLIGVLCEVVSTVASLEKEQMTVTFVKAKLQEIISVSGLDRDANGEITKGELSALLEFPEACKCLSDVGVDIFMLVDNIDFIFAGDDMDDFGAGDSERALSFTEFMDLILDLRGSNTATVKDFVQMQKYIKESNRRLRDEMHKVGTDIKNFIKGVCLDTARIGSDCSGNNPRGKSSLGSSRTTCTNTCQVDLGMEESLKILKEEIRSLVGQSMVPELQVVCAMIESECRKLLESLASEYAVRIELTNMDYREAITQNSLNSRSPSTNKDTARVCRDAVQQRNSLKDHDTRVQGRI